MTIAEVRADALKNYTEGGDTIYECWEDFEIEIFVGGLSDTEARKALDKLYAMHKG